MSQSTIKCVLFQINWREKMAEGSNIGNFYADKSVFVTGATGFMGKVIFYKPIVGLI